MADAKIDIKKVLERIVEESDGHEHESEKDNFDRFLKEHGMHLNPFSDKIVDRRMFINKDRRALTRVLRSIKHNQSSISIFIAPTGAGKSENADFLIRNLPEEYLYWYNQIYRQTSKQLASSIIKDLDPSFDGKLRKMGRDEVIDTFNKVLTILPKRNKKLFCIFDQGEHFSQDSIELIVNATNPHFKENRSFSALILAVPRFEKRLDTWAENYDTTLKRVVVREYLRPFDVHQCVEYIARGLAISKRKDYIRIIKDREFDPFNLESIGLLIEKSKGHPSTLTDLCYLSLEIAADSLDSMVSESTVKEAWRRYPNKTGHKSAVKWYKRLEGLT